MRDKYKTKQERAIRAFMESLGDQHITAGDVSDHFQELGTPISTATVYRHLEAMVEEGTVKKYTMDNASGACYQYLACAHTSPHYHFKCRKCGSLLHVECDSIYALEQHILDEHNFYADISDTVFVGLCAACKQR